MENPSKRIDIGATLNHAIELYKKTFLISGMAFLFITVFLMTIAFIGIQFFIGFEVAAEQMKTFDPANLSLKGTLIYLCVLLLITILIAPFSAGILKMMQDADSNEEVTLSSLFYYVNSPYYTPIIMSTVILSIISFGLNIGVQKIIPDKSMGSIISMFLSIIFSVITLLSIPNIIFKDMPVLRAIKSSISQTSSNFFQILLLLAIAVIIGYFGLIAFCIGIFFTFPIYFAVQYCIYKSLE